MRLRNGIPSAEVDDDLVDVGVLEPVYGDVPGEPGFEADGVAQAVGGIFGGGLKVGHALQDVRFQGGELLVLGFVFAGPAFLTVLLLVS